MSKSSPRVSVIMGVYNGGETLELAIESIINQTYLDWEFIICDDCSTDESWYILSQYEKDHRFILIKNKENLGLGATLNKCSELAHGDYIARMDADDISCQTRFFEQVDFLDSNPSVKVLGTGAFLYNEYDEVWGELIHPSQPTIQDWLYGPKVIHASVMMRRGPFFSIGGYNPEALRIEDYDLWLRMLAEGYEIRSLPRKLYGIRWMRSDYDRKKIKYRILDFKCRLTHFQKLQVPIFKSWLFLKPVLPIFLPKMLYSFLHMRILRRGVEKENEEKIGDYCPSYYSEDRCLNNNKILLLARYGISGASTRVRSLQYFSYLRKHGYKVTYSPLLGESYLKQLYSGEPINVITIIRRYFERAWLLLKIICKLEKFDIIWIEYEIYAWMPPIAENLLRLLRVPFFVDYDDAVFHKYDKHKNWIVRYFLGNKIDRVMQNASMVIAGNDYIKHRAQKAEAKKIRLVPTVVDINRYKKGKIRKSNNIFTIGWIGSPSTSKYIELLYDVLLALNNRVEYRFVVVGAGEIHLPGVPVEYRPWQLSTEVADIQSFDVGLMPLPNGFFEKGKCGYKLIQYLACEVPVIASPVGVNTKIVDHGINGFIAETADEWLTHLKYIALNPDAREEMGIMGRRKIVEYYSSQVMAPRLLSCIHDIIQR